MKEYGSFKIRFLAHLVDYFIVTMVKVFVFSNLGMGAILNIILTILYYTVFIASRFQATPGKMLMGLKVGDKEKKALSLPKSLFRCIVSGFPVWIYFVWAFSPSKNTMREKYSELSVDANALEQFMASAEMMMLLTDMMMLFGGISVLAMFWYFPIVFTKEKTGLHDIICKTRVRYKNPVEEDEEEITEEPQESRTTD